MGSGGTFYGVSGSFSFGCLGILSGCRGGSSTHGGSLFFGGCSGIVLSAQGLSQHFEGQVCFLGPGTTGGYKSYSGSFSSPPGVLGTSCIFGSKGGPCLSTFR